MSILIKFRIPIAAFLISLLCAWGLTTFHRAKVADLVNLAGKNEWPVILLANDHGLWLCTLEDNYVYLSTPGRDFPFMIAYGFAEDGHFEDRIYLRNLEGYRVFTLRFPDYRYKCLGINKSDRPLPGQLETTQLDLLPFGCHLFKQNDDIFAENFFRTERIEMDLPDEIELPQTDGYLGQYYFSFVKDGSAVFLVDETDYASKVCWRIDTESGETLKIDNFDHRLLTATYDGSYVFCFGINTTTSFWEIYVLDGRTMDLLKTYSCDFVLSAHKRWFAISDGMLAEIRCFDLENDFAESRITMPRISYLPQIEYFRIALYEPPPNGLDGMNENYVPDD